MFCDPQATAEQIGITGDHLFVVMYMYIHLVNEGNKCLLHIHVNLKNGLLSIFLP